MKNYTYRIIIEPDENNTFHGFAPTLRGCHTWGNTIEETRKNLKDAMKAYIFSLFEDKQPVPQENGLELFETISQEELTVANLPLVHA